MTTKNFKDGSEYARYSKEEFYNYIINSSDNNTVNGWVTVVFKNGCYWENTSCDYDEVPFTKTEFMKNVEYAYWEDYGCVCCVCGDYTERYNEYTDCWTIEPTHEIDGMDIKEYKETFGRF